MENDARKIFSDAHASRDPLSSRLTALNQYLAVSATVIIVYDSLLSFESELNLIWRSRLSSPKVAYLAYRYLMLTAVLIYLYSDFPLEGPSSNDELCTRLAQLISIIMFSADAVGHFLVIFRTFMLWERNTRILQILVLGSIAVNISSCICQVLAALKVSGVLVSGLCTARTRPLFVLGVWISQAAFEIYVLILIIWNAVDRPRLASQRLLKVLVEDGLLLVLTTWVIRMANVALCLSDDPFLPTLSISLTESLITVISLKLLRHTFEVELKVRNVTRDSSIELGCLLEG